MLRRLSVENYALIDKLEMELDPHLNIITGETGAGKSILLGALGLLLGAKNDGAAMKDAARNCSVEGTFDLEGSGLEAYFAENDLDYAAETTLTRVITPAGKSRAFINDVPVSLGQLREVGTRLVDIHSQHQNLILSSEEFRTSALDTMAGNGELLARYAAQYARVTELRREASALRAEAEEGRRNERCEEIFQIQSHGLARRLAHTRCSKAVIGISGGLDSTLALLVTARTFDKLGLDRRSIIGITMPGFGTTDRTYRNALELMRELGVTQREIPIREACMQHFRDIGLDPADRSAAYENAQARERTQILMDVANGFADGGIHEAIEQYEDTIFYELLAEELALRDLDGQPLTRENYDALMARIDAYLSEFDEHGTDRVTVDLDKG